MNEACCLDLPLSARERVTDRRRRVGRKIAHKRLLEAAKVDRYKDDETNLVFRRQSSEKSYRNCIFLDENDIVLASDSLGYIDIVRLPGYDGSEEPRRGLGSALCTKLSAQADPQCKLHSLQGGHAFAVGLSSGDMRVFATEHAKIRWSSVSKSRRLKPVSVSQVVPESMPHNYVRAGWCLAGPRRRYQRHLDFPLSFQLQNPGGSYLSHLVENYGWEEDDNSDRFIEESRSQQWDFRETASGTIQALHIGNELDMFSLTLLDERTAATAVCVDMDDSPNEHACRVSATCFVNDNLVASSVLSWNKNRSKEHCCVKLWDIRMLNRNSAVSNVVLASFPRDKVHGMQSIDSWQLVRELPRKVPKLIAKEEFPSNQPSINVCGLTRLHNGNIMASTSRGDQHFLIDPVKQTVVSNGKEFDSPLSTGIICYHLYAVEKQHGTVAIYDRNDCETIHLHSADHDEISSSTGRGQKRKQVAADGSGSSAIQANIRDIYGLQSMLNSLAFNESGTSLIGTSTDGGIYSWRAA